MKLSVIIVNYNVRYFLEQCLLSVMEAAKAVETEVFVVDNNSVDGSVHMVREKFPWVKLIENQDNAGFSKANNQAIRLSQGKYILLLNPDTLVESDTFSKCCDFMDSHPDAGGLGVKMIDGSGKFLPESKRGLPTPAVAFYKMSGLSKIFRHSKQFNRYHLGYLPENETNSIEILAGAYMLMRKDLLDKIGYLDETFFMYGEDIDLSWRIIKAGFKNYYFPETRIIHYKGESTKKTSVNYVLTFYQAMIIFSRKHFTGSNANLMIALIQLAIYFRAFMALTHRFFQSALLPVMDFLIAWGGIWWMKNNWVRWIFHGDIDYYPAYYILIVVPLYILIWQTSLYLGGSYDKKQNLFRTVQGYLIGSAIILVFYALLNAELRFSRAMIVFGTTWGILASLSLRMIFSKIGWIKLVYNSVQNKRIVIVSDEDEFNRVSGIMQNSGIQTSFIGWVKPETPDCDETNCLGEVRKLHEIVKIHRIDEVILCSKNNTAEEIISIMTTLQNENLQFRIVPAESSFIIGSNSINSPGDLYMIELNTILKPYNRRYKRFFDLAGSLLLLLFSPVLLWFMQKPFRFILNIVRVLTAQKSWIGFCNEDKSTSLPKIKAGILHPAIFFTKEELNKENIHRANILYARDYRWTNDLHILLKGFRKLGN